MVMHIPDVSSVEEMLAIAYHCAAVEGQMGKSIAEGRSSERTSTVENRKMATEEVQDKHATMSAS